MSIITFYSYKGGVGRTMALANVALILAEQNKRILLVDWDLEAPGLEEYFDKLNVVPAGKGLIHLLMDVIQGRSTKYTDYLWKIQPQDGGYQIDLLQSGREEADYYPLLEQFSTSDFFENAGGVELEKIRNQWINDYDFVLIDSRTGLSDASGVCTIFMPDVVVGLATATRQSLRGTADILKLSQQARDRLSVDRTSLSIVPILTRVDTSNTEAAPWVAEFSELFSSFIESWLPSNLPSHEALSEFVVAHDPLQLHGTKVVEPGSQASEVYNRLARLLSSGFSETGFEASIEAFAFDKPPSDETKRTSETDPLETLKYDVYLSFAHGGVVSDWVEDVFLPSLSEALSMRLKYQPNVFLLKSSLSQNSAWNAEMSEAIERSRTMISFLTPSYFRSEWCMAEWRYFEKSTSDQMKLPLSLVGQELMPRDFTVEPEFDFSQLLNSGILKSNRRSEFEAKINLVADWVTSRLSQPVKTSNNRKSFQVALSEIQDSIYDLDDIVDDVKSSLEITDKQKRLSAVMSTMSDILEMPDPSRHSGIDIALKEIGKNRDFDLLLIAANQAVTAGVERVLAQIHLAQAQIELKLFREAVNTLERASTAPEMSKAQLLEIFGLKGTAMKLAFLGSEEGEPNFDYLASAVEAYENAYRTYGNQALWHGVNLLALLVHSDKVAHPIKAEIDRSALAREIVFNGKKRITSLPENETILEHAIVAEAHIALGDWGSVEKHLSDYIRLVDPTSNLGNLIQQLSEIWLLDSPQAPDPARRLISELHSALASTPGAAFKVKVSEVVDISEKSQDSKSGPITKAFEPIVGDGNLNSFVWAEKLAKVGKSIAKVTSNRGRAKGTAFLINGVEFFGELAIGRHFVITTEHIVNTEGKPPGLMPQSTLFTFTRFPNEPPVRAKKIVWSSPRSYHDASIIEIFPPPKGTTPFSISAMPQLSSSGTDGIKYVTVIGHPMGRELSLAINNLELIEHNGPGSEGSPDPIYIRYSSSTEPGSSGSPVLDWDTMELIGFHHKGFRNEGHVSFRSKSYNDDVIETSDGVSRRRRRGSPSSRRIGYREIKAPREKRVKANQGVWLQSVVRAIRHNWPEPPDLS